MPTSTENIIVHLNQSSALHQHVTESGLTDALRNLQDWQTRRLLVSYQDMWDSKRFRPAMAFFIDELYGPKDFSQRDQEIARVVPKMAKLLPQQALDSLEAALRLNCLSYELDVQLAEALGDAQLDRVSYAQAYRQCDNQPQRIEQITLLENLGQDLARVVKISGISTLLMLSRKPAKLAGVESLHVFLETGFKAFKKLGKVDDFILPIVERERQIMLHLFDPDQPNPLPEVSSK
ncbi:hypothetical protein [Aliiglaciecola sp. LCG003]|uniref:FFLEELY motif protein n=1 Tax=Aliiglaciecola sp. LCG003 TaxID=3053655 RepID=UPI00257220AD|nr:hypothetical protein [Aliiglaciecola sp. LCG003]WJG08306.1 hypothetical protein QR722_13270 [Aliiglaciecola sp. LCG003]